MILTIYREMKINNIKFDKEAYHSLLLAMSRWHMIATTLSLENILAGLYVANMELTVITYYLLVKICLLNKNLDYAKGLMKQMIKEKKIPDNKLYSRFLEIYVQKVTEIANESAHKAPKITLLKEVDDVITEMLSYKIIPNTQILYALLRLYDQAYLVQNDLYYQPILNYWMDFKNKYNVGITEPCYYLMIRILERAKQYELSYGCYTEGYQKGILKSDWHQLNYLDLSKHSATACPPIISWVLRYKIEHGMLDDLMIYYGQSLDNSEERMLKFCQFFGSISPLLQFDLNSKGHSIRLTSTALKEWIEKGGNKFKRK